MPEFAWTLCLQSADDTNRLKQLTDGLNEGHSADGNGKRIEAGLSYWGIESTVAWLRTSSEPLYTVAKVSAETFVRRWRTILPKLGSQAFHYVSLGPGDGAKDHIVLRELGRERAQSYFPVDISAEMLRNAARKPLNDLAIERTRIFPVEVDFSDPNDRFALRALLDTWVGYDPVLFGLLGNTLANFTNDTDLLTSLRDLVRPNDLFMLEVATTDGLDEGLAELAAQEYAKVRGFREFVTSTLQHATDLTVDTKAVDIVGDIDRDRALSVKFLYRNGDSPIPITLPDQSKIIFDAGDTIRLHQTRKYMRSKLVGLVKECGFTVLETAYTPFVVPPASSGVQPKFGMELLLLRRTPDEVEAKALTEEEAEARELFPPKTPGPRSGSRR